MKHVCLKITEIDLGNQGHRSKFRPIDIKKIHDIKGQGQKLGHPGQGHMLGHPKKGCMSVREPSH